MIEQIHPDDQDEITRELERPITDEERAKSDTPLGGRTHGKPVPERPNGPESPPKREPLP